jgi:elongation factor P
VFDSSDIKKGLKIQLDGVPFNVIEFQFVKPGKGTAFTRTRLKNLMTGAVIDRTFRSGEKLTPADIEQHAMQFLYKEGDMFVFMDTQTYEQLQLVPDLIGDNQYYLTDGTNCDVLFFSGRAIGVTPPTFVEMKVEHTEPGFKGDTSSNATKPATMAGGLDVQVPLFVEEGEILKIDTRTGGYVERVRR